MLVVFLVKKKKKRYLKNISFYVCEYYRICLTGQMVSCDFCPAHFHLNCLNPPLCNIPDTRWMCPLHPHHILVIYKLFFILSKKYSKEMCTFNLFENLF